ncbi:hypothetical protein JYT13_01120 [Mariprofundus ferrooxydans]|nr:hypothetical protein [Mariprofundus ferrooxydans]
MDYTDDMKQWMLCVAYVLLIFVMSGASVLADEMDSSMLVEKHAQQVSSVQNKSREDCASISMDELVERLKRSKAIGFFTKLAIRSDVLDFQAEIINMRKKKLLASQMSDIKASFNGLLLKIMALLEKDPDLSKKIYLARHSILQSFLEVQT